MQTMDRSVTRIFSQGTKYTLCTYRVLMNLIWELFVVENPRFFSSQLSYCWLESPSKKCVPRPPRPVLVKGSVSRDFLSPLFSWFEPIWPLINRVKWFWFRFRPDIRIFKRSAVCIPPASIWGVRITGVHPTAKSDSVASHCRVRLPCVHPTVKSASVVCTGLGIRSFDLSIFDLSIFLIFFYDL